MALFALAVVPALVLEDRAANPSLRTAAVVTNWLVWIAFAAEFLIGLRRAERKGRFVRESWFDVLIIVLSPPIVPQALQSTRVLRAARLLRLVRAGAVLTIGLRSIRRAFGKRKFHYVGAVAVGIVGLGALGVYLVEHGQNKAIASPSDALWWAIVTATTVGYGDVSPVTSEGRVLAVILMLTGIGVIGVFTATLASFFVEGQTDAPDLDAKLSQIEQKLDSMMAVIAERSGRDKL